MDKYKFMLTEEEANTILGALGELPAKTSLALILNIQRQYKEQTEPVVSELKDENSDGK